MSDNITCPQCGHEHWAEAEEIGKDGEEHDKICSKCGIEFEYNTNISVTFSSRIKP